jgi:hypothetical protein
VVDAHGRQLFTYADSNEANWQDWRAPLLMNSVSQSLALISSVGPGRNSHQPESRPCKSARNSNARED